MRDEKDYEGTKTFQSLQMLLTYIHLELVFVVETFKFHIIFYTFGIECIFYAPLPPQKIHVIIVLCTTIKKFMTELVLKKNSNYLYILTINSCPLPASSPSLSACI